MFEILFVCHANQCRSPLAERIARHALADAFGTVAKSVGITSAGTKAYAGAPMWPQALEVLTERGLDATAFASRPIEPALLQRTDLVLTAGRAQRAACVQMAPALSQRAFTIRQFARMAAAVPSDEIAGSDPADALARLVAGVNVHRHLVPSGAPGDDELADPVGRPIEEFRACADEIERSWNAVLRVIAAA